MLNLLNKTNSFKFRNFKNLNIIFNQFTSFTTKIYLKEEITQPVSQKVSPQIKNVTKPKQQDDVYYAHLVPVLITENQDILIYYSNLSVH